LDPGDEELSISSPLVNKLSHEPNAVPVTGRINQMEPVISGFSTEQADKIEDLMEEEEDKLLDLKAEEADNEDDDEYADEEDEEEGWQDTTNLRTSLTRTKDLAGKPETSKQPRISKLERDLKRLSIEDKTFGGTGKSKNKKKIIIHSDSEEKQDGDEVPSLPVVKKKRLVHQILMGSLTNIYLSTP